MASFPPTRTRGVREVSDRHLAEYVQDFEPGVATLIRQLFGRAFGPASAASGQNGESDGPNAVDRLTERVREDRFVRLGLAFMERNHDCHLKDLVADEMDDQRRIRINGQRLVNFGSDSFLGLDRDKRVQQAIADALGTWGTHNGSSRSFSSVRLCEEAERRLADWLGVSDTLIFPSVTLANAGVLPSIVSREDLLVVDRNSHESIWQGAKIAQANQVRVEELKSTTPAALEAILKRGSYRSCVVAVDGVYSMTGAIPPLKELDAVTRAHGGIMYIDDAHGTGLIGPGGRGAAFQGLERLDQVLMIGSLSKAFSCLGAFTTCNPALKLMIKMKASTYIFGGPVPPPYLAGVIAVCDILNSPEFESLVGRLRMLIDRTTNGVRDIGLEVPGGESPIVSIVIGDLEQTLKAGRYMFDRGYYVQSAVYPAVPINGGLLRVQVNANHAVADVDGLLGALSDLKRDFKLRTVARRSA